MSKIQELYAALNRDFQSLMAETSFLATLANTSAPMFERLTGGELGRVLSPRRRYAGVVAVSGANRLCADSGWSRRVRRSGSAE